MSNENVNVNVQLWERLLRAASSNSSSSSSSSSSASSNSVLLLGNAGSGKRSLVEALVRVSEGVSERVSERVSGEGGGSSPEFIAYTHYRASEVDVDVWRMGKEAFRVAGELVLDPAKTGAGKVSE
jgi:recombinational DNA repair ATPase RecF